MSTVTNLPLHEVVLKIMFQENIEKAAQMTASDVLWKIDNPEISERKIREVLDWLVRQKKVELYLGKYSIDRIEFLEQKELHQATLTNSKKPPQTKVKSLPKKRVAKQKTFYVNPPKIKHYKYNTYILVSGLLLFGYLTYTFLSLNYKLTPSKTLLEQQKSIVKTRSNPKQLYVSKDNTYTENEKKAISYSFARQNNINNSNIKNYNTLQFTIDSITNAHKTEMKFLQKELQNSTNRSNSIIKKIMYCNVFVILLVLFLYFKRR